MLNDELIVVFVAIHGAWFSSQINGLRDVREGVIDSGNFNLVSSTIHTSPDDCSECANNNDLFKWTDCGGAKEWSGSGDGCECNPVPPVLLHVCCGLGVTPSVVVSQEGRQALANKVQEAGGTLAMISTVGGGSVG